jgi:hypothetical protein
VPAAKQAAPNFDNHQKDAAMSEYDATVRLFHALAVSFGNFDDDDDEDEDEDIELPAESENF